MINKKSILVAGVMGLACIGMIGCSQKVDTPKDDNATQQEQQVQQQKEVIDTSKFIPNGDYKVIFKGSDMANELLYLKGDGTTYEAIGVNGRGYYREIFKEIDGALVMVANEDLSEYPIRQIVEMGIENVDTSKAIETMLKSELSLNDEWDNDEIKVKLVEVGENLKLSDIQLEGTYVKTTYSISEGDTVTTFDMYYSEGLGIVKYTISMGEDIVEFSELTEYEKLS